MRYTECRNVDDFALQEVIRHDKQCHVDLLVDVTLLDF